MGLQREEHRWCGGETKVIGHDTSEALAMGPIKYYVEVTKREKRACPKCEEAGVKTAPLPERIVDKWILSDRVIIDVTIKKYCDHQPLFRQMVAFKRDAQIDISRTTLCESVRMVRRKSQPRLDPYALRPLRFQPSPQTKFHTSPAPGCVFCRIIRRGNYTLEHRTNFRLRSRSGFQPLSLGTKRQGCRFYYPARLSPQTKFQASPAPG
ncbi:MAG: IS66 family transposase zinc-finger binding domain-containing protein, partial [Verrucomicrobiota bacterium]